MIFYLELILLLIISYIAYETSSSLKYYVKFGLYYGGVVINCLFLLPYFLLRPFDVTNLLTAGKFCSHISKVIGLTWTLRGTEHLGTDKSCVIVANHQSSLDVLDIWPVMNKTTVVAKRELMFVGPFGIAAYLSGLVFIDRLNAEKSRNTLNEAMAQLKENKTKLWVFPEGTRRNTNEIHPFKKGAFNVAINSQVPILPVVFSSYRTFLDDKNKILNTGEIIIEALPEISTIGMTTDNVNDLIERTRILMIEKFNENTKEIQMKSTSSIVN
ncbi:unnamed protein product [Diamesa serratosioi]